MDLARAVGASPAARIPSRYQPARSSHGRVDTAPADYARRSPVRPPPGSLLPCLAPAGDGPALRHTGHSLRTGGYTWPVPNLAPDQVSYDLPGLVLDWPPLP